MGMMPEHLHTLTIGDFVLKHLAFMELQEREDERARRIVEAVVNYGGLGTVKFIGKELLWPLNLDAKQQHQYIVNKRMALELLEGFE